MPLLARWIHRAMANQTRFWSLLAAAVVVLISLTVLASGFSMGRAASDDAWTKLETAKTPGERVEIAREFPKTQAERWALLQAATEYYNQGFNDLPMNRDAALPQLKRALDLFEKVGSEAPKDSPLARVAAFGTARTLEARNDLDRARRQYETVAQTKAWKGTQEAVEAERLARTLKTPEVAAFYKELYAFKPVTATLPPGGLENLKFPLPANHPPMDGPVVTPLPDATRKAAEPNLSDVPPPPPSPAPKNKPTPEPESRDMPAAGRSSPDVSLPLELFSPADSRQEPKANEVPAPAPSAPKARAEKPAASSRDLPDEPFSPGTDETQGGTPK
ncbi:MAG: hypothetical protein NVSMB9_24350 [Isosphaeraceae bacterium]